MDKQTFLRLVGECLTIVSDIDNYQDDIRVEEMDTGDRWVFEQLHKEIGKALPEGDKS